MKYKILIIILFSFFTGIAQKVNYLKVADSIFEKNNASKRFIYQKHFWGDEEGNVAVAIGNLFETGSQSAVLIASKNDSVYSVKIYRKSKVWNEITNFEHKHSSTGSMDDILDFADIDFDGVKDLVLLSNYLELRSSNISNAWLYKKGKLKYIENLDQFPNFEIDKSNKRVLSYISCGCSDYCMSYQIGKVENFKIITEYSIFIDCCEPVNNSCSVQINNGKPFNINYSEVYKQVPKMYQSSLKEKMRE